MRPEAKEIQRIVAYHFDMTWRQLLARDRHRSVTKPRGIAMAMCRFLTDMSFPEIGRDFGGRDHTTVIAAVRRVSRALDDGDEETIRAVVHVRTRYSHRVPLQTNPQDDAFVRHCVTQGLRRPQDHHTGASTMSIADLTGRDGRRLIDAIRTARSRHEGDIVPPLGKLMGALGNAIKREGDFFENLAEVLAVPVIRVRQALDLVKEALTEKHGAEYTEDLWQRFLKKGE